MTYADLHKECIEKGYFVEVLTTRALIRVTVYYGDAWKALGAVDEFQSIGRGVDHPKGNEKPSINKAAKQAALMVKLAEGSKRAKWWESDDDWKKVTYRRTFNNTVPEAPLRGEVGSTDPEDYYDEEK